MKYDYTANYLRMTDEELLRLLSKKGDLVPEASVALDKEMQRRGLVGGNTHGANLAGQAIRIRLNAIKNGHASNREGAGQSGRNPVGPSLTEKLSALLLLVAGRDDETRRPRMLTACAVAIAAVCLWVPWEGYYGPKDKMNPYFLGYGFLWSPPEAPQAFVTYDRLLTSYQTPNRPGLEKPRGYVPSQAFAQPSIDYGRILLEIAAILALALVAWLWNKPRKAAS